MSWTDAWPVHLGDSSSKKWYLDPAYLTLLGPRFFDALKSLRDNIVLSVTLTAVWPAIQRVHGLSKQWKETCRSVFQKSTGVQVYYIILPYISTIERDRMHNYPFSTCRLRLFQKGSQHVELWIPMTGSLQKNWHSKKFRHSSPQPSPQITEIHKRCTCNSARENKESSEGAFRTSTLQGLELEP